MRDTADETFMEWVQADDLQQLTPLFDRYHVRLYNFFFRLTGSREASRDLVQNVFLRVIKYRKSYKTGSSFKTWVYQVARNVHADHYQDKRLHQANFVRLEDCGPEVGGGDDEDGASRERMHRLQESLTRLPSEMRELLLLSRFQQMKYAEIAGIYNCTAGAIKVKVHRAIKALREIYFERQPH